MTNHLLTSASAAVFAATMLAACSSDAQTYDTASAYAPAPNYSAPAYSAPTYPAPNYDAYPEADLDGAPLAVAPAQPDYAVQPSQVKARTCDIIVRRTGNGVLIKAVANPSRYLDGDYSFVITKNGRGGSSDINQGGPFDARAGERVELGVSELSLERGAGYRATLVLSDHGREICRRTVRN
jgi:hypothetical protein